MSDPDARNVAIAQRRSRHRINRGELRPSLHRRNPSSNSVPTSAVDHNRAGRKTSRRSSSAKLRRHAIRIAKTTMTVAGAAPIRPARRRTDRQPRIDPIRGTATALGNHRNVSRHAMGARPIRHASALVILGGGRLANGVSARREAVLSVSTR